MNRSDKEQEKDRDIMMALLTPQKSIYELEQTLRRLEKKLNYVTILRHIKKMQKNGLVNSESNLRKNGEPDKRKAMKIELTSKGLATLLIDGDLQEKELKDLNKEICAKRNKECSSIESGSQSAAYAVTNFFDDLLINEKHLSRLSRKYSLIESYLEEIFVNSLLEIKPKINLKFFDEEWFYEVYVKAIGNAVFKAREKYPIGFEKLGIWKSLTEKERQEAIEEFEEFEKEREEAIKEFLDRCTSDSETVNLG